MKIAVMALSGGMDSTSLLLRLLREGNTVYTIGFNYGQKHVVELSRAQDNIDYLSENGYKITHNVVDLSSLMSMFTGSLTSITAPGLTTIPASIDVLKVMISDCCSSANIIERPRRAA